MPRRGGRDGGAPLTLGDADGTGGGKEEWDECDIGDGGTGGGWARVGEAGLVVTMKWEVLLVDGESSGMGWE